MLRALSKITAFIALCSLTIGDANAQSSRAKAAERSQDRSARIFGGYKVDAKSAAGQDWLFAGSLRYDNEHICSVSFLKPDVQLFGDGRGAVTWYSGEGKTEIAITAAHCVVTPEGELEEAGNLTVFGAQTDLTETRDAQIRKVAEVIPHPGYDDNLNNDIAILVLEAPFQKPFTYRPRAIRPVELWLAPHYQQATALIQASGWGATETNANGSNDLLAVNLPYADQEACRRSYGRIGLEVNDMTFCAGYISGGYDTCQGDSGSGVIFDFYGNGARMGPFLVGIVSWGEGCAEPGLQGIYTDVLQHMPWIESVVIDVEYALN